MGSEEGVEVGQQLTGPLIAMAFSVWLELSILRQCRRAPPAWLRKLDIFGLVPSWRFFSPVPMRCDYRLFFRDHLRAGGVYGWVEVTPYARRGGWSCLWNPNRRLRKAFEVNARADRRNEEQLHSYYLSNFSGTFKQQLYGVLRRI